MNTYESGAAIANPSELDQIEGTLHSARELAQAVMELQVRLLGPVPMPEPYKESNLKAAPPSGRLHDLSELASTVRSSITIARNSLDMLNSATR